MTATTANAQNADKFSKERGVPAPVAAIVIGRNEGARLVACLRSLRAGGSVDPVIYVDSGSTDDSVSRAADLGAQVVVLDPNLPFTAARARNTGLRHLQGQTGHPDLVQFVDGDCEIEPSWIAEARAALQADPQLAIVAGRRRERFPDASVYNRLCDAEWDTAIGPTDAVGGDLMARMSALVAIGGYRDDMIAGEEPEMCLRLRRTGARIARLDQPMTIHDANMHRFGQWWRRARRAGHAFAEGSWLHRHGTEPFWRHEVRRAILWAVAIPAAILLAILLVGPWALLGLLLYPLQILRLALRDGGDRWAFQSAAFLTLSKFPEAIGIVEFHLRRLFGSKRQIIEYK